MAHTQEEKSSQQKLRQPKHWIYWTKILNKLFKYIHRTQETVYKELKESITMFHEIETISYQVGIIEKNQINSGVKKYNN